jgi:predicted amidohydrolase YtcJ
MQIKLNTLAVTMMTAVVSSLLLSACSGQNALDSSAQQATTVYSNGTIITMNPALPLAESVAVRDGRIMAVGTRTEVAKLAGNNSIEKDLAGKTLIPGLIDAHGHITYTAASRSWINLASPPIGTANSIADIQQLLESGKVQQAGSSWLIGWGYDDSLLSEQRHPNRNDLDRISTDKPIFLRHVSGHLTTCNSKCLEIAGITADTPNPKGGVIQHFANGEPNGVLEETAMHLVYAKLPTEDLATKMRLLDEAQQYYASYGITTVQDGATFAAEIALLQQAASQQRLTLDVVAYPYLSHDSQLIEQHPPSREYRNHFRVGGAKLVLDGSPQGKTAWLQQPYLHPPEGQTADYRGYPTLEDAPLLDQMNYLFEHNIQVLAHANGDAAGDQLIRIITQANDTQGIADRRSVMIHAQTAREDQLDQMQTQGIIPSYFVAHTYYWGDWHRDSVFGVERASRISPLQSTIKRGMRFTTHNDAPIVPPDMMRLLWASVNRITRSGKVLGEAQRVSPMEALKSITIDAAYQYFEEQNKGSIEAGKLADFTILSDNPLTIDPVAIKDIQILQTIKEGETIFSLQK